MEMIDVLRAALANIDTYRQEFDAQNPDLAGGGHDTIDILKAKIEELGGCSWIETAPQCNCNACSSSRWEAKGEMRVYL